MAEAYPSGADDTPPPKKHTATRIAVALGAWEIGSKLGWIGNAIDASRVLKETGKGMGIRQRGDALWRIMQDMAAKDPNKIVGWIKAILHVGKFSLLLQLGGGLTLGVLGWMRAEKLGSAGQILHHPIRSLKILVGLENPPAPATPLPPMPIMQTTGLEEAPQQKRFTDSIQSRGDYRTALATEPPPAVEQAR